MTPELILLIVAAVKSAVSEILVWSGDKSEDEIKARRIQEEDRTKKLMDRMRSGGD